MAETFKVYVGVEPKTVVAYQVLRHSIIKHASRPVEIVPMIGPDWEYPLDGIKVGTGFSLRRWMIPAACGWEGHALYLDSDQLVFADVCTILDDARPSKPGEEPVIFTTYQPDKFSKEPWPQTSVMAIDCRAAKSYWGFSLDDVLFHLKKRTTAADYANFMHATWLPIPPGVLPTEWNHLNRFDPKTTKLLHLTNENTQCWYDLKNPVTPVWESALVEAIEAGNVSRDDFDASIALWSKPRLDWRKNQGLNPYYAKYRSLFV